MLSLQIFLYLIINIMEYVLKKVTLTLERGEKVTFQGKLIKGYLFLGMGTCSAVGPLPLEREPKGYSVYKTPSGLKIKHVFPGSKQRLPDEDKGGELFVEEEGFRRYFGKHPEAKSNDSGNFVVIE